MLFRQLFDRATWTYTYLIADLVTREAALVDPVLEQVDRDYRLLTELELVLKYCLETHIHADHITGTGRLRELTECEGVVPQNANAACASRYLQHGEILRVGNVNIQAIETHGHTDSHMSYRVNGTHVLTGDALFIRGCGRTDFQSGDAGTLYDHVTQRLFTLPDETLVYPGHDYQGQTVSTIDEEKRFNPRFVGKDRASFIQFMNNLHLPNPKRIMEAVPANEQCGKVVVTT
ncbi:MBL fold metallo-hydrolase [Adonisia turfae]|uniref:MBL fold metallo-hydrolase n=1 Tax=Adonisia turfae CCMR0081 TaxID=2292702 RepID=A0A6M0RUE5_9CYAN|nr:MBL fold metallo-hydrolase [Adonisia turfae]NEZ59371.1 MBL fold metallo-hydrolase [Adonisia turfae CCMR0081]